MISKSPVYNSMYFATVKLQKLLRGPSPLSARHQSLRLLFHTAGPGNQPWKLSKAAKTPGWPALHGRSRTPPQPVFNCTPVHFNIFPKTKYIFYIKYLGSGRHVALSEPDPISRATRRAAKMLQCHECGKIFVSMTD